MRTAQRQTNYNRGTSLVPGSLQRFVERDEFYFQRLREPQVRGVVCCEPLSASECYGLAGRNLELAEVHAGVKRERRRPSPLPGIAVRPNALGRLSPRRQSQRGDQCSNLTRREPILGY